MRVVVEAMFPELGIQELAIEIGKKHLPVRPRLSGTCYEWAK